MASDLAAQGSLGNLIKDENGIILARWYGIARVDDEGQPKPLGFKMVPGLTELVRDSGTGQIVDMRNVPIGGDREELGESFARWWEKNGVGSPQVLLTEPEEGMNVEGDDLDSIRSSMDEMGRPSVNFDLTNDGGVHMGDFTWAHKPGSEGEYRMAIVLDNQIHTAPTIQEPIYGSGRITGSFTQKEVNDLVINLRSGKIDVALNKNPISKQFIESALGQELKEKGIYSIGFSFILVLVFMIVYYRFSGVVAALALLLNVLMIMAFLMAIQQSLTLTGLAGLVLTVGMSVDANVLIFERIREELDRGAALRMAIRNGFDKATTTIIDANVTTLITAIVLYVIGTEQIKGFAVTLILGILISMFTAVYCSRVVFDIWERKRWVAKLSMARIFSKTNVNFIRLQVLAGILSICLIGIGIGAMFLLGPKILNHDLRGGSTIRIVFSEPPADGRDEVLAALPTDYEVDGELIEFSVSKLLSPEHPDCVFKIDSNLPTYDGEGDSPYEQLDALLARVFDGKLALLHVDIGSTKVVEKSGNAKAPGIGMQRPTLPQIVSAIGWLNPAVILIAGPQDQAAKTDEAKPAKPADKVQDPASVESANDKKQDAGVGKKAQAAEKTDAQSGGDLTTQQPEVPVQLPKQVTTSTELKFRYAISGKALGSLLLDAAQREDVPLEESQLKLSTDDAEPGAPVGGVLSDKWTVEMKVPKADDASRILSNWAGTYNNLPYFPTISGVGGQVARETQLQALAAIFASFLGIIAYVWIRFQNVAFGVAAVVALIHDVLIVLGAIALSHFVASYLGFIGIEKFKISLPVVAALLTLIGYSLNDTIVVFDRIREVRGKRTELTADIINVSISQTLSRTILTALTTFIVVFILYWSGGDAIHGFAFALVIGIIVGTYSSIFIASPILLWLMNRVGLNPGAPIETADDIAGKLAKTRTA